MKKLFASILVLGLLSTSVAHALTDVEYQKLLQRQPGWLVAMLQYEARHNIRYHGEFK